MNTYCACCIILQFVVFKFLFYNNVNLFYKYEIGLKMSADGFYNDVMNDVFPRKFFRFKENLTCLLHCIVICGLEDFTFGKYFLLLRVFL